MSKTKPTKILHFAVEEALAYRIENYAEKMGLSQSAFLRQILRQGIGRESVKDDVMTIPRKEWDEMREVVSKLKRVFSGKNQ